MQEQIKIKLQHIEKNHNIRILYACESGSRAWGFPSADSDYDIRFIYCYPPAHYLTILGVKEQFNFAIDDDNLDISGWELRRTLNLLLKSNCTPFEWLQSPVIYYQSEQFQSSLFSLCPAYFDPKRQLAHYLGLTNQIIKKYLIDNHISIKKLFYILRPLLAARWCQINNSIPPMSFTSLLPLLPLSLQTQINEIIEQKQHCLEKDMITLSDELLAFIDHTRKACYEYATQLKPCRFDSRSLDLFFKQVIGHDN